MNAWPPTNATRYFLSPVFVAKMRAMTTRLVRLFPTQTSVAEDAVYDALSDLFLSQKARGWGPEDLREWLRGFQSESRFDGYLFRTAYRIALKGLRQQHKRREQTMRDDLPDPRSVSANVEDLNSLVERVAAKVSGDEREILHLLVEGASISEIAERLKVSEQSVYRIRRHIRGILWTLRRGREK